MSFAEIGFGPTRTERTYLLIDRQNDSGSGTPTFNELRLGAQDLASSSLDHQVVDIERADPPVVGQAAKTDSICTRAWNNMNGFSKFLSIGTIGIYYLLYVTIFSCCGGGAVEPQPTTNVRESVARRPVVERQVEERVKPPKLVSRRPVSVDPYDVGIHLPFPNGSDIRAREIRENTIARAQQTLDHFEEDISAVATSLQLAASGSGIIDQTFKEALISGTPLEEIGIKYYRFVQGKNEICQRKTKMS